MTEKLAASPARGNGDSRDEKAFAIRLANKMLDRVNADPDDDLAVLSRQFLRALERAALPSTPEETGPKGLEAILEHAKFLDEIVGQVCEDLGVEPDADDLQIKLHEKVIQLQFPSGAAPSSVTPQREDSNGTVTMSDKEIHDMQVREAWATRTVDFEHNCINCRTSPPCLSPARTRRRESEG